jgi:branched-chain amino acid transport system substrate-binding protein
MLHRFAAAVLLAAAPARAEPPTPVHAGVYVLDIADLNLSRFTYRVDFYLWLSWRPRDGFDPTHFEFANGRDVQQAEIDSKRLADGREYRCYRIRGEFRGRFDFHRYPFDQHVLPVALEDQTLDEDRLVYVPEPAVLDPALAIPSWRVLPATLRDGRHAYATDFGDADRNGREETYARATLEVPIDRQIVPYLIKFILPLLIIVNCAFLVFFIHHKELEVQSGISVTALLLAIAFHISQADKLPEVGYVIVADWFFFISYLVIFATVAETVWCHRLYLPGTEEATRAADRVESVARKVLPGTFYAAFVAVVVYGLWGRA